MRFRDLPAVAGPIGVRFYAAATLRLAGGQVVGALCVMDVRPRRLSLVQREILSQLANAVAHVLELRRSVQAELLAATALAERDAWLRELDQAAPIGIFHTDSSGACPYTNPRWRAIFGLDQAHSLGRGWSQTLHPQDRARGSTEFEMDFRLQLSTGLVRHVPARSRPVRGQMGELMGHVGAVEDVSERIRSQAENPVQACLKEGKTVAQAGHTLLISRHGEEFGVQDSVAPIRNEKGDISGVVLVFHDVTEQGRLSGEMTYRATHDQLTGLINRAEFEARLRRVLAQAQGDRSQHALLYIDLDQFKRACRSTI